MGSPTTCVSWPISYRPTILLPSKICPEHTPIFQTCQLDVLSNALHPSGGHIFTSPSLLIIPLASPNTSIVHIA